MAGVLIDPNEYLNLLDPPKDLAGGGALGGYSAAARTAIKTYIFDLFGINTTEATVARFTAAGDTKKIMKKYFETGFSAAERRGAAGLPTTGLLRDAITNTANKIRILRDIQPNGHDPRPTGLFIAQDSGSKEVVKNPRFIITPGTILDPAGKTKEGDVSLLIDAPYNELPYTYIERLQMQNAISGPVTMENTATGYKFTIPLTFPTDVEESKRKIVATLDKGTFLPVNTTVENPNADGVYFKGNVTKNNYIQTTYTNETECKKYILVKELGDSLQVAWLKYIIDSGGDYTNVNTAIITCDTVLWYRALLNEVGVILTYEGETNYYAANPEAAEAAFMTTIREEAISANIAVIETIQKVIDTPREARTNKWLNASSWGDLEYGRAIAYLTALKKELVKQNNDFDAYFEGLANRDAAKALAARVHFLNPFVWSKSERVYVVNTKVIYLRQDGGIKFSGANFKKSVLDKATVNKLEDEELYIQVPMAGGGIQKGGARATRISKIAGARGSTVEQLIRNTDGEWGTAGGSDQYTVLPATLTRARTEITAPTTAVTAGNRQTFLETEVYRNYWQRNVGAYVRGNDVELRDTTSCFFYLFIRDFCPEIFTLGAMVKSTGIEGFNDVTIALPKRFPLSYWMNTDGGMLVYVPSNPAYNHTQDPDDAARSMFVPPGDYRVNSYTATINAIALANLALAEFPYLQTKFTKDFLAFFNHYYATALPNTADLRVSSIRLAEMIQVGGGPKKHLLALAAIQNYEIYYALAIGAAYEDRNVTENDFQTELRKADSIKSTGPTTPQYDPFSLQRILRNKRLTGPNRYSLVSSPAMSPLVSARGGKSKYKKTHKKKQRKHGKKTRKHRR